MSFKQGLSQSVQHAFDFIPFFQDVDYVQLSYVSQSLGDQDLRL